MIKWYFVNTFDFFANFCSALSRDHPLFVNVRFDVSVVLASKYDVWKKITQLEFADLWDFIIYTCEESFRKALFRASLCSSVYSRIEALCQTSFGPDNYTLSWDVRNTSSISMFRVYHEGVLQGTTFKTNFTVQGLQPCQQYQARVEALCGDGVLMSAKTVTAHTGNLEIMRRCIDWSHTCCCYHAPSHCSVKRKLDKVMGYLTFT